MLADRIVGLITARGGSKGIPGKNIRTLAGKPLIAWTIEAAKASRRLDRLIVSTDDSDIARVAVALGAEVPFTRPVDLAQDESPVIESIIHAIDWLRDSKDSPTYILTLQPTSPLRTTADIDASIDLAVQQDLPAVIGVCESRPHPLWAKWLHDDGTMSQLIPYRGDLRRQSLPVVVSPNGAIYLNRCHELVRDRQMYPAGTKALLMPALRSVDIDTEDDWYLAELILRNRNAVT